jgi:hypothetical protein
MQAWIEAVEARMKAAQARLDALAKPVPPPDDHWDEPTKQIFGVIMVRLNLLEQRVAQKEHEAMHNK